jgi:hypothetical protein
MVGLYSPKGPDWANMGRSFIRSVLNSARGLSDKDNSPEAQNARRISGFADLDGIEFVARVDVGTDTNGDEKNDIRVAVTKDHKDYVSALGGHVASVVHAAPIAPAYPATTQPAYVSSPIAPPQPAQMVSPAAGIRPTWAR